MSIEKALEYHEETSYDRSRMTGHTLDWTNQPSVFKDYEGIEPVPLPQDVDPPPGNLSSILERKCPAGRGGDLNLGDLSLVFRLTSALTAQVRHPDGAFYLRSAASAGALYPTEIYVAAQGLRGLEDGLYHFAVHHHALVPLRRRQLAPEVSRLVDTGGSQPLLTFFLTAIFFRSSWKYRARAYRYHLLDTGHVAENLVLALKALGLPFSVHYDFDDRGTHHLLGLDETLEVALAVVWVPEKGKVGCGSDEILEPLPRHCLGASRVSRKEIQYPQVREMHLAGTKVIPASLKPPEMARELGLSPRAWTGISGTKEWPEIMDYGTALFRRRSRRNFVGKTIPEDALAALLGSLSRSDPREPGEETGREQSTGEGFLLREGGGMEPGFYLLDPAAASADLVTPGSSMDLMARICLDQAWLKNAAVHFVFMANLEVLEDAWGPRGYRYAMLSAGRKGQRLYLVATALGLGCCGIGAFYDQEAKALLGLNRASRLLYLVAVGAVKRT